MKFSNDLDKALTDAYDIKMRINPDSIEDYARISSVIDSLKAFAKQEGYYIQDVVNRWES